MDPPTLKNEIELKKRAACMFQNPLANLKPSLKKEPFFSVTKETPMQNHQPWPPKEFL